MRLLNKLICLFRGHIYYDCICGRCGKHLFDAPIKKFFKRIVCLFRGHEYPCYPIGQSYDDVLLNPRGFYKCTRCGKIKEEVI